MIKKTIAIAMGGYSSEYEISLQSGKMIYNHIDRSKYQVYKAYIYRDAWTAEDENGRKFPVNKANFSIIVDQKPVTFDAVFNIIHGKPGEDGLFQAYLEIIGIPQTASNYYEAALSFNKRDCISVLKNRGFKVAENYALEKGDPIDEKAIIEKVGLPCFVKANRSGSSFGISKVKNSSELKAAIEFSFKEDNEILIESFLSGTEVSVGVIDYQGSIKALPVTEIVSKNEFFDYKAKYLGQSEEITPARLSKEDTLKVQKLSERVFKLLNLKGFARAEFIFHQGEPHFLEVNTCPGMSEASIVPQQLKAANITFKDFFSEIIEKSIATFN